MTSKNLTKITFCLIFTLIFCSSCNYWQESADANTSANQTNVAETKNEVFYPTKEPENYQLEIVVKSDGEEQKTLVAKSGQQFFAISNDIATLKIDATKSYLISFDKRIFAENLTSAGTSDDSVETLQSFLTTELLNGKTDAKFENLGDENGLTKYRALFGESESLIYVDENFKLPMRQEFYSINGEERTLMYSSEIQNLKLKADETFFEVPKDFRKVSLAEFQQESAREKELK
jgi:outer membrane lipoprotein-sorting protein